MKHYLQGYYGKAPGPINEQVRRMSVGHAVLIECRPADLLEDELDKLRQEADGLARSEEDVLTYAMFPDLARTFFQERAAGSLKPEPLLPKEAAQPGGKRFAPNEFHITLHGETYHIKLTGSGAAGDEPRPFYVLVDGVSEEVAIETLSEIEVAAGAAGGERAKAKVKPVAGAGGGRPAPTHKGHVTTAMPGTIVDVLVDTGKKVKAGDPVLVIEAMKMENEIQAPVSGAVTNIFVSKGDAVKPNEALIEIQPE